MLDAGLQLGPYTILSAVGKGGMGEVYRAMDTRLGREVAVKTLPEHLVQDAAAVQRFEREAKVLASLSHPNILTIYDVGAEHGLHFVVMELLRGETLRERMNRIAIPWEMAIDLVIAVGEGLSAAHSQHITHRDLKPENIFLTADDHVKILDFGLARQTQGKLSESRDLVETASNLSEPGMLIGTLGYMSPEQVMGQSADIRSDIFSLGCIFYEMLAGIKPFSRQTQVESLAAILKEKPVTLANTPNPFSVKLDHVIMHCLEKRPEHRFQSVGDLMFALREILQDHSAIHEDSQELSVAVLYFENLSGLPEDEYFRDGMTEDVITELSKIRRLKVFSRSTVVAYRDKPGAASEVGRLLHAAYVLEGSVRRSANRFRITARLVRTDVGHSVWSERYDRQVEDIFELQDDLARSIANALRITLSGQEEKEIASRPTGNPEAYDYYMRGRALFRRRTRLDLEHAYQMFERAAQLQPDFALGFAGMSYVSGLLYDWYGRESSWISKATVAADRALELEPQLPEGLVARALIAWGKRNFDDAIDYTRLAISKKPHCDGAYWILGASLFFSDRPQDAADLAEQAVEASGDDYNVYIPYLNAMHRLGRSETARRLRESWTQVLKRQLEWVPEDARARLMLANIHSMVGQKKEAIREIEEGIALRPNDSNILYNAACVYGNLQMKQESLVYLKKAVENGIKLGAWMAMDPDLAILHDDDEFKALIKAAT